MPKSLAGIEVYLVWVDQDRCDGCEECLHYCPVNVFDVFQKATPVRARDCMGCGTCVAACPVEAIVVTEI